MKNKAMAMLLVAAMTMTGLAGCGNKEEDVQSSVGTSSSAQESTATESASEEKSSFNETGYPIVNEPLTLKIMLAIPDTYNMIPPNEMKVVQDLEEKTGITLEWEVVKVADWGTKLNLMFVSGEYPDIILNTRTGVDVESYGVLQKLILPVEELTEQYMPIYTERTQLEYSDPTTGLIASDGHKYVVGNMVSQNINVSRHYFINEDWLEALKLEMPDSVEELTDVLRAFKTQDPNGNGKADEIPAEFTMANLEYVLPLFGVPTSGGGIGWTYIDDNKQIQLAVTQDGFRECMEWLHLLYEEELLDAEFISQDNATFTSKLTEANVGFFPAWRLQSNGYDVLGEASTLYTPSDAKFPRTMEMADNGVYILSTNEHIPETMRLLDAMLETETMFSLYYGEQGVGWEYAENGKISEIIRPTENDVLDYLSIATLFYAPGTYYDETFNLPSHRIEKIEYCKEYEAAGIIQKYSNNYINLSPLNTEQLERANLIRTDIHSAVLENAAAFVKDGVTDKSWDAFVDLIEDIGVAELMQIYQSGIDQMDMQ